MSVSEFVLIVLFVQGLEAWFKITCIDMCKNTLKTHAGGFPFDTEVQGF